MAIEKKIKDFIEKHNLIPKDSKILLGLSGGPDSVFLLDFLAKLKKEGLIKEVIAAYLDHEWRPESSKDAQFCLDIAKKYGTFCVPGKMSDFSAKLKFEGSKEEFGRKARRYFFELLKKEYNCDLVALAHHAQDQQETFFIRLIRGSSLSGLTAMKPKNGPYIRPLLEINKQDIINFLDKNNIAYLTDPSNISQEFLRNRIRQQVIPALQACDKRFDQNFKTTMDRLQDTEQFLEQLTHKTFKEISSEKSGVFYINLNQLLRLHPVMLYRVLIHWLIRQQVKFPVTQSFLDEIIKFLKQPGSKEHQILKDWSLVKKKNIVHIKIT
ncbi:tRNA lysidine(34) synthetase TilS [Candidatus Dependentiae bacterium]